MKRSAFLVAALALWCTVVSAADPKPFSQGEFDQLARAGKPVVVDVAASWCPTCKAQKPIVESLSKQPAYEDVAILMVDFDADKNVVKQFKVTMQSTLIAFKGGKETGRSVGDTTPTGLENLFKKAIN